MTHKILFAGLLFTTFAANSQTVQPLSFNTPPRDFTCSAQVVASGDFNNDGLADLICIGNTNSVLLGDGHGRFLPGIAFPLLSGGTQVALADLNGDGNLDVIVLYGFNPLFYVFLGNGDGTFQPASQVNGGTYTSQVMVTGDINGDGKLDLILLEQNLAKAAIFLGQGNGTFRDGGTIQLPYLPQYAVLIDLDKDGSLDLAISGPANFHSGVLMVCLGKGDGSFTQAKATSLLAYAGPLLAGDFNSDGIEDLIVYAGTSEILLGRGDGSFQKPLVTLPGLSASGIIVADFNHDGKLDVAAQLNGKSKVEILLGDGTGTFAAAGSFPIADSVSGFNPQGLVAGNFDQNSTLDLMVGGPEAEVASLLLGKGNGSFLLPPYYDDYALVDVATSDVNGDGRPDIVSTNSTGTLGVLLGNGNGTFQQARFFAAAKYPGPLKLGDFTSDGKLDAIITDYSGYLSVIPGQGDGTFGAPISTNLGVVGPAVALAVGDFNHDGLLDAAISNPSEILLGKGDGTFYPGVPYIIPNVSGSDIVSIDVADFNGDGKPDLVALVSTSGLEAYSEIVVLLGNGDGTFLPALNTNVDVFAITFRIADLDGDGFPDLAISTAAAVDVVFGNGDGTFRDFVSYQAPVGTSGLAIADFNLDGKPDLALTSASATDAFILFNRGNGTFREAFTFLGAAPGSVHPIAADFNGDGKADLALAGNNAIFVYTNTAP